MSEDASVGLCATCSHARVQPSAKGSVFWRCLRAASDPRFRPYPPLPVRECPGFEKSGKSAAQGGSIITE